MFTIVVKGTVFSLFSNIGEGERTIPHSSAGTTIVVVVAAVGTIAADVFRLVGRHCSPVFLNGATPPGSVCDTSGRRTLELWPVIGGEGNYVFIRAFLN